MKQQKQTFSDPSEIRRAAGDAATSPAFFLNTDYVNFLIGTLGLGLGWI
jgi:hypothetical protein